MSGYMLGNLLGRLLVSWLLVLLFSLVIKKGRMKAALRASVWPWGWLAVLALFGLGLLGTLLRLQHGG
ncbi:hypothetical protein [Acidithiobacillus sp. AMEEHan]|uniref:hypothetical protein n=1 Tax=Acidithiobacillus sp. AMEEHan TaxID=2994951 RepID=UPI0027E4C041|nr:hypothetical protein [Acidithiobacillus sp. AMEEHan]